MNQSVRVLSMLAIACGLVLAAAARADSGSVWSLSQDGQVLNKVATWERGNGVARIVVLGSTLFLEVNLRQPISSANEEEVFGYTAFDTHAQPESSGVWEAVSRGELALDGKTMTSKGVDGWWRRTHKIERYVDSTKLIPQELPRQKIRFIVEKP